MRPHRARMVYSLVSNYGLSKYMSVFRPEPRSFDQLTEFHADEYIGFLKTVSPNNVEEFMTQLRRFNMGLAGEADCPVFDGLYQYCQTYSGGSVDGAAALATQKAEIAFNWSGGMHHAKKAEASGFCYVNDIVLGILELLKVYARVLYVDIDIHHGDGVEEAFYLTDRVMTVSFHKYGEFFPGTGAVDDIGTGKGKGYTVNVPLKDGMDDDSYKMLYEPIMSKVMEMFQPQAIVMCCGADSLSGDRLGCFNLSLEGHSNCLEFLQKYNVPMLVLGGGGYTLRNVSRCWTYETGRMMGLDLPDNLPEAALAEYNYYLDTQRLRIAVSNMKNANTREELEEVKVKVLEHLSHLPPVPSAQMAYRPPVKQRGDLPEEDLDVRGGGQVHEEMRRVKPGDESDDDEEAAGRGVRNDLPARDTPSRPSAVTIKTEGGGAAPMEEDSKEGAGSPSLHQAVGAAMRFSEQPSPTRWEVLQQELSAFAAKHGEALWTSHVSKAYAVARECGLISKEQEVEEQEKHTQRRPQRSEAAAGAAPEAPTSTAPRAPSAPAPAPVTAAAPAPSPSAPAPAPPSTAAPPAAAAPVSTSPVPGPADVGVRPVYTTPPQPPAAASAADVRTGAPQQPAQPAAPPAAPRERTPGVVTTSSPVVKLENAPVPMETSGPAADAPPPSSDGGPAQMQS